MLNRKHFHKILPPVLAVVTVLTLAACENNALPNNQPSPQEETSQASPIQLPQNTVQQEQGYMEQQEQASIQNHERAIEDVGVIIAAGQFGSFTVLPDGSLWGWGLWGDIEWYDGMETPTPNITPQKIMDDVKYVAAAGWSDSTAMILKVDGSLWALGSNPCGQFGDGSTTSRDNPVKVMDDIIDVSVGGFHTMVIKADGSLWTFGGNWHGQLGDSTTIDRYTPVKIMDDVIAVSAGSSHSMAITSDGVLWGWGHNGTGRLGYEPTANELNPIHPSPIKILDNVAQVSAGHDHTLAIKTNNTLWAWGNNFWGSLGVGPPVIPPENPFHLTPSPSPIPMQVLFDVAAISAGNRYSMAITSDGVLWGWGFNEGFAKLGLGDAVREQNLPAVVSSPMRVMDDAVSVSAWDSHTLAVRNDGSVWAWGNNTWGQIGDGGPYGFPEDGTIASRNTPTLICLPY